MKLTPRQLEIVQMLVTGMKDKEIRTELGLRNKKSISRHVMRACRRLGLETREQLIAQSVALGFVNVPIMAP